ncbi:RNA polymerase sigma factor [Microbacterium halotolerans]|uniref:RNA polymerase sigma factor n=1 Tax=Microbacterium halotolerans TaxID=246613 RepID=UPI000E6AB06B|nr:sigma-70 family RNA polymerase sigma factor [Microbacterium halotolerans]
MTQPPGHGALDSAADRIIAGRAADGDPDAFAVLVRRHAPLMRAYVRRMLPGTADVDDVVQEAFITAWERLPELNDLSKVRSWLMRITGRKATDRLRSSRRHIDIDDVEAAAAPHESPSRVVEARAGVEALSVVLGELPHAQRECWMLREIGGYSYDEIAEQFELSASTVRGMLARARKHMLVRMEEWR